MYDIFFIDSSSQSADSQWINLKQRFPHARRIKDTGDIQQAISEAAKQSFTTMFWVVWDDVKIADNFTFDFIVPNWDQKYVHIFKNKKYFDGICLISKTSKITKRELDYRFFFNKKEIDVVASTPNPAPYDIVFISFYEEFANNNFEKLKNRFPDRNIHRIDGIKGIHNAHIEAAKLVTTNMFWVVDADAEIVDDFNFDFYVVKQDQDAVHVWQSLNPVNELIYGYGGVKLLPTRLTLNMSIDKPDMTTSISSKFKALKWISNVTAFNTDPFSTWRSAFRECVKLSSKSIRGQVDEETEQRLDVWCTVGKDKPFGEYCIKGAIAGRKYGILNQNDSDALVKINNYTWIKEYYEETI